MLVSGESFGQLFQIGAKEKVVFRSSGRVHQLNYAKKVDHHDLDLGGKESLVASLTRYQSRFGSHCARREAALRGSRGRNKCANIYRNREIEK